VTYDYELEEFIIKGIPMSQIFIKTKIAQFYTKGVITKDECLGSFEDQRISAWVAVIGYNSKGSMSLKGSKNGLEQRVNPPYFTVRMAFGPYYGYEGSMRIEKSNWGYRGYKGACYIYNK
jgi:Papain family cysteine protease